MLQNCSNGPPEQTPSFTESVSGGVFAVQVASEQSLGLVTFPGRPQLLPGHSVVLTHAAPALLPLAQRVPPQTMPDGQSALVEQASPAASPQVSQKHLRLVKPGAVRDLPPRTRFARRSYGELAPDTFHGA